MDIRYCCVSISFATFPRTQDSTFAAAGRSLPFFFSKPHFSYKKVEEKDAFMHTYTGR
jgi:hypothetical protein